MAKKKILLVGRDTSHWHGQFQASGEYEINTAVNIVGAVHYLRETPDAASTQLLVAEELEIKTPHINEDFPPKFEQVKAGDRGAAFIEYVRQEGLISSSTPAYLATRSKKGEKYDTPPEGVTKVIRHFGLLGDLVGELRPTLHRTTTIDGKKTM